MRHKKSKLIELQTGQYQKRHNVMRTMLTNLIQSGKMETTQKRAMVIKSYTDRFFGRLMSMFDLYSDEKDVKREMIRFVKSVVFAEEVGKKVISELVPKYKEEGKTFGFVRNLKVGVRKGDASEKILLILD